MATIKAKSSKKAKAKPAKQTSKPSKISTSGLEAGDKVPAFTAATSVGTQPGPEFSSEAMLGKKWVLYFYPKDNTPGCTIQANQFNDLIGEYQKLGYEVYGVSRDSVKSHCGFSEKFGLKFPLIADEDEKICQIFGVIKEKNMYGKMVLGVERSTFVIDDSGVVTKALRKVTAEGHALELLNTLKA
ncbi:MAG TPA: peroxiredoxin [Pseudobdellovibrionaceae bacterium]|nr:peroxiredoxin [Pseudobdellovibrionaceae bacterium]